jgi:SAM-dependent methyltransferase
MEQRDIVRFQRKDIENSRFWARIGGKPDLTGKTVLDVGCGQGGLCIDLAQAGAEKVVGVDIESRVIEFARESTRLHYPDLLSRVDFRLIDLAGFDPSPQFDIIVSKDSFEHIVDIPAMFREMKQRLKPGGRLYIGFGPLYNSINGAHSERLLIPWGHLFMPESLYLKFVSWDRHHPLASPKDFQLNMMSFREYCVEINKTGMEIEFFKTNQGGHPAMCVFRAGQKIPFLREYCTANIYCILRKN